ncbi:SIMPL domain-containing protein [Leptolyngbya sp. AN02str]|uniref:SIMPL domain-containing protein n=1 Tax=Leptolyngbya sp. AN02str TaxID=3423363 RepID=UPI003D31DD57
MKSALSVRTGKATQFGLLVPLAVGCLSLMTMKPAMAQQAAMTRIITVVGQGSEDVATTLTQVQLGVDVQKRTAEEAQREAARLSSSVVELLRSRNVEKLQTTGISLNPVYSYDDGQQRLIGYSATNTVSFRVATDRAGNIVDDAVNAGATRINGISFVASDEAIARARQQALREATEAAQSEAEAVLSSLGLRSQEIVGIQINGATPIFPPPMPLARMEAADASQNFTTPIVGGEQEIQASVTLQIRY